MLEIFAYIVAKAHRPLYFWFVIELLDPTFDSKHLLCSLWQMFLLGTMITRSPWVQKQNYSVQWYEDRAGSLSFTLSHCSTWRTNCWWFCFVPLKSSLVIWWLRSDSLPWARSISLQNTDAFFFTLFFALGMHAYIFVFITQAVCSLHVAPLFDVMIQLNHQVLTWNSHYDGLDHH